MKSIYILSILISSYSVGMKNPAQEQKEGLSIKRAKDRAAYILTITDISLLNSAILAFNSKYNSYQHPTIQELSRKINDYFKQKIATPPNIRCVKKLYHKILNEKTYITALEYFHDFKNEYARFSDPRIQRRIIALTQHICALKSIHARTALPTKRPKQLCVML